MKKLQKKTSFRVVFFRATEVPKIRDKIENLPDRVKDKNLELQTIPGLMKETTKLLDHVVKLRETLSGPRTGVNIMDSL